MDPNPTYLRQRDDLTRFKDAYQAALRTIARDAAGVTPFIFSPQYLLRSPFSAAGKFFPKSIPSSSCTTTTSVRAASFRLSR